jgi:hypothetical protein
MYPDKVNIEPGKRSPWIVMDPGRLFMMGRSIIENPGTFYEPIHYWVTARAKDKPGKVRIDLGFEYINTGSIKWLYILLRDISEMKNFSTEASITWYYEEGDEDMSELGHIIRSLVDCRFAIVKVSNMSDAFYRELLSKNL